MPQQFAWIALAGFALVSGAGPAAADPEGKAIYQHCKNCHGVAGEGGKAGKYPRIGGLPQDYIERQLANFKSGKRVNKRMVPIFKNWRFDSDAMSTVAAYVAQMPVSAPAPFEPSEERLAEFDSREEFDDLGATIYDENCAQCHGDEGLGRTDKEAPPLVKQYPNYLFRQIAAFIAGEREHEHANKMFGELYEEEIEAVLTHIGKLSSAPET